MRTTEQWLSEKIAIYNKDPKEALKNMLSTTTEVIEQYLKSPSKPAMGVLEACLEHNRLFLQKIGIDDEEKIILLHGLSDKMKNQTDIPSEFGQIINDNFNELT